MLSIAKTHRVSRFLTALYGCAALGILAVLFAVTSPAQSTFGEFTGTVKDPSGAVVAGATITVKNLGTSAIRTADPHPTGSYTVVNLEPATYEITMKAQGFQKKTYTNLPLQSRETVRVDGTLGLATQAQTVEVNVQAEAPINTECPTSPRVSWAAS